MKRRYLLGIDIGTSSVKVALVDEEGHLKDTAQRNNRVYRHHPGWEEMNTSDLWKNILDCLYEMKERGREMRDVCGIGISCLCPGLVAMDESGKVLVEPIIYSDRRSVEQAEVIKTLMGEEELFQITANRIMAGAFSATSMLWIKKHRPQEYAKTKYFGHLNTWLGNVLTGEFAIDYTNASYTSLFETVKGYGGSWSEKLCHLLGIDREKLPPLLASSKVLGNLNNADLLELGFSQEIKVVIGAADTPCAALATGVLEPGDVCESVGTTNVLTMCVDRPKFSRQFINRCHLAEGRWIYQGAMSYTGASYQWFHDHFFSEETTLEEMNRQAQSSPPGANGVVFLPYMNGERSPVWDNHAKGMFFGITLQNTKADFNRAILEACGYGMRQLFAIAQKTSGHEFQRLHSIGGGAKSITWAQIKADITGKEIVILDANHMAPIGAALLCGVGCGVFKDLAQASRAVEKKVFHVISPDVNLQENYQKNYQTYIALYPSVKQLF